MLDLPSSSVYDPPSPYMKMKLPVLATTFCVATATAARFGSGHHGHDDDRHIVTIRPSSNDTDDVSIEFLQGITEANHGGRLLLKEGETYIIGKKLELTFLDDIEVQLDGEIKVWIPDGAVLMRRGYGMCLLSCGTKVHRRHRLLAGQQLLL